MSCIQKTKTKKRRRSVLENQFRDAIISPPKLSAEVIPHNGMIEFIVPSTSKHDVSHKVLISCKGKEPLISDEIDSDSYNHLSYKCTCIFNKLDTPGICKHIRASLIHIMLDLLKQEEETDISMELSNALTRFSLADAAGNCHMDTVDDLANISNTNSDIVEMQ
jgi:hypothetical protein